MSGHIGCNSVVETFQLSGDIRRDWVPSLKFVQWHTDHRIRTGTAAGK